MLSPSRFSDPYEYYSCYFIPYFLSGLYRYRCFAKIPQCYRALFRVNLFYQKTPAAFFRALGLLTVIFLQGPRALKRLQKSRPYQWQYRYAPAAVRCWGVYIKVLWLMVGKTIKAPLNARPQVSSFYQYTIRGLRAPEISYYDLQVYGQGLVGYLTLQFRLSRQVRTIWEEVNLLRMWNVPLFRVK